MYKPSLILVIWLFMLQKKSCHGYLSRKPIPLLTMPTASDDFFTWRMDDGSYQYGMQGQDQWRVEKRYPNGAVHVRYSYRTPDGKVHDNSYSIGTPPVDESRRYADIAEMTQEATKEEEEPRENLKNQKSLNLTKLPDNSVDPKEKKIIISQDSESVKYRNEDRVIVGHKEHQGVDSHTVEPGLKNHKEDLTDQLMMNADEEPDMRNHEAEQTKEKNVEFMDEVQAKRHLLKEDNVALTQKEVQIVENLKRDQIIANLRKDKHDAGIISPDKETESQFVTTSLTNNHESRLPVKQVSKEVPDTLENEKSDASLHQKNLKDRKHDSTADGLSLLNKYLLRTQGKEGTLALHKKSYGDIFVRVQKSSSIRNIPHSYGNTEHASRDILLPRNLDLTENKSPALTADIDVPSFFGIRKLNQKPNLQLKPYGALVTKLEDKKDYIGSDTIVDDTTNSIVITIF